eukprot:TRINITY_DN2748_c0_g1_i2.p1 TRINITY_DN2748_c0_g1~~TRINITY_DN2748_c0_g1_i2.p1  ORF type:complete len:787 (-),score=196.07 TRINITY_DN2748_c0_g1_i2:103-2412(-)
MAATQELLQKLQRQRLRMGELGDGVPPVTPAQGAEGSADDATGMNVLDRSSGSSCDDEVQGELQLKLKRQRRRIGESALPLQEISNQDLEEPSAAAGRSSVDIGGDVKVRQRALKFEGIEHASPSRPHLPGRVNLERWEPMLHTGLSPAPMSRNSAACGVEGEAEEMRRQQLCLQQKEISEVTREQQQQQQQLSEASQEHIQECGDDWEREQQTIEVQQVQQQQLETHGKKPQCDDEQGHQEEQGEQHRQFGMAHDHDQYLQIEEYQMHRHHELEAVPEIPEEELSQIQTEELNETIPEEQLSRIQIEYTSENGVTIKHESDEVETDTEQLRRIHAEELLLRAEQSPVTMPASNEAAEGHFQGQHRDALRHQRQFTSSNDAPGFKWSSIGPVAYESDEEQDLEQPDTNCEHAPPANLSAGEHVYANAPVVNPTVCEDCQGQQTLLVNLKDGEGKHVDEARSPGQAAQCYSLADGDDDIPEDDCEEPFEFAMLDYCGSLPAEVVHKLRDALKMHEDLLRKLDKRNKVLRLRVRGIRQSDEAAPDPAPTGPASPKARPSTPPKRRNRCPTSPQSRPLSPCSPTLSSASPFQLQRTVANVSAAAAEARRQRVLRAEMSSKVEAISTERARQRDAQAEANLKARLEGTVKASKEQILAMQRRAEQEEERIRMRFEMAMRTRDGLERSLKGVLREQEQTKEQIADLEDWFCSAEQTNKAEDKGRIQAKRQEKQLASELKAHRARAQRCQQRQRRTNDMIKELEMLKTGLQKYIE